MKSITTYTFTLIFIFISILSSSLVFASEKITGTDLSQVYACYKAITKSNSVNGMSYRAKNAMCDCEIPRSAHWKCSLDMEVAPLSEKRQWHASWGYGDTDQEACDMAGTRGETNWTTTFGKCTCGDFNRERGCYILTREK